MSTIENSDIHQSLRACNRNHPVVGRSKAFPWRSTGKSGELPISRFGWGRWYSGDHRFTRQQKEQLTQKAKAIMEHDRAPRTPPAISIRECQEAIEIAGGIRILLRGEERLITEVRTAGGGNTRWFSGDLRFTVTEQHRLTRLARAIIEKSRNPEL